MPPLKPLVAVAAAVAAFLLSPGVALGSTAAGAEPAGGAALPQVAVATAAALAVTAALLALGLGHRSGRARLLARAAALGERLSGLPGWASLPLAIAAISLLTALFGMYWDISLHIDVGRDAGPLANPAHYFILAGLFGVFSAGFVAMVLPRGRPSPTSVQITSNWHAPLGGVLICACGAFSLLGFPLDDVWHRLFGQDVTLWGPTHLMLIGGAAMTLIGMAVLVTEAGGAAAERQAGAERGWVRRARLIALTGGLLIGLSTFQAEFDFGVPQFRFVFHPLLIMLAASVALVAARLWLGRGAALGAAAFFVGVRGGLALLIGPGLDQTLPHFPLYLAEAALVELVALRVPRERPLVFGAVSGVLIGTVGLAAEWGWSHLWMPLPWPAELLPEAALLAFATATAGALIGAWIGARLGGGAAGGRRSLRAAAAVSAAAVAAIVGFALHKPAEPGLSARVALDPVARAPEREVVTTVRLDPPDAGDDAEWLTVTAWQGGGLVVDRLREVRSGTYRGSEPIPVHGEWKALLRLHRGDSLMAVPIYLPADPAIPAGKVPARQRFQREFVADHELLQREQRPAASGLTAIAYGVVLSVTLALLGLLAWGLHRVAPGTGTPAGHPLPSRVRPHAAARRGYLRWRRA